MIIDIVIAFSAGAGVAIFNKYILNNVRVSRFYKKYFVCCKSNKMPESP